MARISICSAPSILNTCCRCWRWRKDNLALEEYLIGQVLEFSEARFAALREFYPNAEEPDWRLEVAGQRVQIIKKDPTHGGILQFGTDVWRITDRGSGLVSTGASRNRGHLEHQ
jgi:malate dehydrogenase (quinone)